MKKMKKYKFKKDKNQYIKGQVIEVSKENNLLKKWIKEGVVDIV